MICEIPAWWVGPTYDLMAGAGSLLAMYVMQLTEHDRINRIDQPWLKSLRRGWFIVLGSILCYSIWSHLKGEWTPSLPVLLLVMVGDGNLTINALALRLRVPPNNRSGRPISLGASFRTWEPLKRVLAICRDSLGLHK
jgi:hypothetical protein